MSDSTFCAVGLKLTPKQVDMNSNELFEPTSSQDVYDFLTPAQMGNIEKIIYGEINRLEYPWSEIEDHLNNEQEFQLIGFGSLLNPSSARRTIKSTPEEGHPPCIGFGLKRIFNYQMPQSVMTRYGVDSPGNEQAALNSEFTKQARDNINARLIAIHKNDIEDFRQREFGYDLIEVPCLTWPLSHQTPVDKAWVLCAPDSSVDVVNNTILPFRPYLEVCLDGAALVSKQFEEYFIDTTVLGDGRKLHDWLQTGKQAPS